ncbi:MAG TPA: ATP-binding protein [Candidatus Acidoferrum sp.]|nr:ATP-binding protein [Candidatus Acidoferrum sp.]
MGKRLSSDLSRPGSLLADEHSIPASQAAEMMQLLDGAAFGAVFESSGEALVVVDSRGFVRRANSHARQILRFAGGGERQRNLCELVSVPPAAELLSWCKQSASITPPTLPDTPRSIDGAIASGFPLHLTLRTLLPGSGNLLLCIEDGDRTRLAEKRTIQLEAELSSLLDALEAGVILFDPSGRIRFTNARFGQLFGLKLKGAEVIQTFSELEDLVAARFRDPEAFSKPWKQFSSGEEIPSQDELELVRPVRKIVERYSRPVLSREGPAAGWLELYYDVTGKREIQSKLLQTEKMAALGQLVSGIAHELNNPLTAIMGYAQLLLGHGLAKPQQAEAGRVFQEAERARRIVKNLLYFARENKPERVRVDLNEIVERTLALRSYELRIENILVECSLEPELPETMGDPYQLQQVVLNLLVNAEQALLEDRGRGHVWIRTQRSLANKIALEISDDGPGIAPSIALRIFDPFFTTKPAGIGTGLGLSIAYGIVHQHGGDVSVESQRGSGAKFIVELPVAAALVEQAAVVPLAAAGNVNSTATGRILVVEDEATVAQLIVDVLREEGHEAEAAFDSQEGLTRIARTRYDLVICDLRMPRLDGPAFYDALVRAGSPIQHRMVFITGDTMARRSLEFLESHKLPYLAKPFLVEELKLAVNRILERNSTDAAAANVGSS